MGERRRPRVLRRAARRTSNPSAEMPLVDHLRELRSRLVKSLVAIGIGMIVGWLAYDRIFEAIRRPFDAVVAAAGASGREVVLAFTGVADPFVAQLKIAGVTGVLLASPVWLYQLWRFVTPGLHRNERRWAVGFAAVASPLFLAGAVLAYAFLPKGLSVLLGFTPENVENIISVDRYLSFFLRMIIVFGIGFLIPLLVIGLNLAGVVTAKQMLAWWRTVLMGIVVFAAVATPTGDPFNLALLAVPMLLLVLAAFGVCWLNDRRRSGGEQLTSRWGDDELSDLPADGLLTGPAELDQQ